MRRCLGCMREYKEEYQVCPYCGYEVGTPPKEAYHMVPGTLLGGRYMVGQVLGFGGFGVTYIGYDTTLERKVAIKEYLPSEFSTRIPGQTEITTYAGERTEQFNSGLNKFLEEAQMLAKLQTANGVVQIYNSFHENNTAYIIMEYLEGKTLKTYLEEIGKISVEEAKEILHPIITALKEVHALGIIHRDIAPDNIFLTNDGRVKLLDFGASRFATTSHSKSLSVIIKQGYAPVEQYRSRGDQGSWTDVYSLAATFYKMVTGVTPEDAMERVEKEELKKPSRLGIEIPKNTENAIMNALNIKIEDRTHDIVQFEKELYQDEKVKLKFVHLKKADVGKWPLWAKLSVAAGSTAVAAFAVLLFTGVISFSRIEIPDFMIPEGKTRVPNIINEEIAAAEAALENAELYFQIVDKQYSEYIPQGMVLTQSVNRGKIVDVNGVVEAVVSGGREVVFMPEVCGSYKEAAMEMLSTLGIVVELTEDYGDYAPGVILSQSVATGEQLYRGDTVTLCISKGYDTYLDETQEITIPDFSGMTLEQAQKEAKKLGVLLVKAGTRVSDQKAGIVLEQSQKAGTTGHSGDVVEVYISEKEQPVYMPDVQYKDEVAAVAELQNLGLEIDTRYEESDAVAAGKVISQSIAPYTEVKRGTSVTLVISKGNEEVNLVVAAAAAAAVPWSDWVEELPAGVDKSQYEIETKTQYSFRDKSTTTSAKDKMDGWTLYDTVTTKGEYGELSEWSPTKPEAKADRKIESKTQYQYSDYETIESDKASMSGWTKVKTVTYYLDDYGEWSDWSPDAVSKSSTRNVQTGTQYRYATREKLYTESSSETMSEWTLYEKKVTSWSDWSETTNPKQKSDTYQYEYVRTVPAVTHQEIDYYVYGRYTQDRNSSYGGPDNSAGSIYDTINLSYKLALTVVSTYNPSTNKYYSVDAYFYVNRYYYDETPVYKTVTDTAAYDVYRERTGYYTYYFWKWSDYGSFSKWDFKEQTTSETKKVETRTVYRYQDKIPHYKYIYERWTDYSVWSDTPVTASSTRKVKTRDIYRYCDKTDIVTYYFYQWGKWSDWRDEKIDTTDQREVQTRTLYRYKPKN